MTRPKNMSVRDQLRQNITAGHFDHLPFLPSERELAARYETGRRVIRSALSELVEEGKLIKIPQKGFRLNQRKGKIRFHRFLFRLYYPEDLQGFECSGLVAGLCKGAEDLCSEVILSFSQKPLNAAELRELFDTGDLQGIIFLETARKDDLKAVHEAGIPCVIANLEDPQNEVCCRMDYRQIGRLAGQRLIQSGYRRFGVFSGPEKHFIFKEMLAGFRGALAEEEIQIPAKWIAEWSNEETNETDKIRSILSLPKGKRPEVIFTMRDRRAKILYQATAELHLKIPQDLAVISYDNISWPASAEYGLTTISQDVRQIGIRSVELLREWYDTGIQPKDCIIPGKIVERSSIRSITK